MTNYICKQYFCTHFFSDHKYVILIATKKRNSTSIILAINCFSRYITPEKFYVEPIGTKVLLVVDRVSQQIYTQGNNLILYVALGIAESHSFFKYLFVVAGTASQIPSTASRRKIWGIIGTIKLLACRYLIVITDATEVGTIAGHQIFKIVATDVIPYTKSSLHLSEKQMQSNSTYLEMIKSVLNTPYFYFSYTYDLSHSMQRLHNTIPEYLQVSIVLGYCSAVVVIINT